jgi:hypothetical protein
MKIPQTGNKKCDAILAHLQAAIQRTDAAGDIALDARDSNGVALINALGRQVEAVVAYYMDVGEVREKAKDGAYVVEGECWICGKQSMFQYYYDKPKQFVCRECEQTYLRLLREGPSLDGFQCAADVWAITTAAKRVKKPKPIDEDIRYSLYRMFGVSGDAVPPEPKVKLSEGTHLPNDYIETSTEDVTGENDANEKGKDTTEGS